MKHNVASIIFSLFIGALKCDERALTI